MSFYPYYDIRRNQDGRVVSSTHFTSKEINWYSFLLQSEGNPGLLNAEWVTCKIFNDPTGNRTRNHLSCGAVTQNNCGRTFICMLHRPSFCTSNHADIIWRQVQIIHRFVKEFSPISCYHLPLGYKNSSLHPAGSLVYVLHLI